MAANADGLPHYILFNHSSPPQSGAPPPPPCLGHPTIQYLYADDSPMALIPRDDEHVLVLDCNTDLPSSDETITKPSYTVRSLSCKIAVTGIKTAEDNGVTMYIIQTTAAPSGFQSHRPLSSSSVLDGPVANAQGNLAAFKKRNQLLRTALAYPKLPSSESGLNNPVSPS